MRPRGSSDEAHRGVATWSVYPRQGGEKKPQLKAHIAVDGMIQAVHTTVSDEHDSKGLIPHAPHLQRATDKISWIEQYVKVRGWASHALEFISSCLKPLVF